MLGTSMHAQKANCKAEQQYVNQLTVNQQSSHFRYKINIQVNLEIH